MDPEDQDSQGGHRDDPPDQQPSPEEQVAAREIAEQRKQQLREKYAEDPGQFKGFSLDSLLEAVDPTARVVAPELSDEDKPSRPTRELPYTLDTTIGTRMRLVRMKLGISQAERAKELGISQSTYSAWERGGFPPAVRMASIAVGENTTLSTWREAQNLPMDELNKLLTSPREAPFKRHIEHISRDYPDCPMPSPESRVGVNPALKTLFDEQGAAIRREALRFLHKHFSGLPVQDREDVVDEALRIAVQDERVLKANRPAAYVCSIARNLAHERWRKIKPEVPLD
jgi:transcriptional regulator with XRE-family HTH domain